MKTYLWILIGLLTVTQITNAQLKSYPDKKRTKYEKVVIEFSETAEKESFGAFALAAAPFFIEKVSGTIDTLKAKKIAKFTASYEGFQSGDKFFNSFNQLNIPSLKLTRKIGTKKSGEVDVLVLNLVPELSHDARAFRYNVESIDLNKSKAFANKTDNIDIGIDITIKVFQKGEKTYDEKSIGTRNILLKGLKPDDEFTVDSKTNSSGWFPIPKYDFVTAVEGLFYDEKESAKTTYHEFMKSIDKKTWGKKTAVEAWKNTDKISLDSLVKIGYIKGADKCLMKLSKKDKWYYKSTKCNSPSGNYLIEIKINESNPRKAEMIQKRENIGIAGKTALEVTNFLIEQLSEEEDEEEDESDENK